MLKPTQKAVLKALYDNKNKWLGKNELVKLTKVASNHVDSAVKYFYNNDYLYMNYEGKVQISPDGESLYFEG